MTGGVYRLHGYFGGGAQVMGKYLTETLGEADVSGYAMLETGIINVIGGFELGLGIAYSISYPNELLYPYDDKALRFVLGIGLAF